MKCSFVFFFLISVPLLAQAQKKALTIEDAVLGSRSHLALQTWSPVCWISDNQILYAEKKTDPGTLRLFDAGSKTSSVIISLAQLNKVVNNGKDSLASLQSLKSFEEGTADFFWGGYRYRINTQSKTCEKLPGDPLPDHAENRDDSFWGEAYTEGNNLLIRYKGKLIKLSDEKNPDIKFGQSVHRNEFGINKGTFWSPSGKSIAYYRMDEQRVKDYPVLSFQEVPARNENIKYPMAGDSSHTVSVFVYHAELAKTIKLETSGPYDQYLTNVAWTPDEREIWIAVLSRNQKAMELKAFDTQTGKYLRTVIKEEDPKYVEPMHPAFFLKKNAGFIWQSSRDGYNHLYHYANDGRLIRQVSKGAYEVTSFYGLNESETELLGIAAYPHPGDRIPFKTNLKTGKTEWLDRRHGLTRCEVSKRGNRALAYFNNPETPNEITLLEWSLGAGRHPVLSASDPLEDYKYRKAEVFMIKNDASDSLVARFIKPAEFDPAKKYPVIVYCYGGPHAQMINNGYLNGATLWFNYLADKGYLVFTVDNRGSEARGKEFEQATHKQLGSIEMRDQLTGLSYLKSLPYVDSTRIGIHGWSFGGFMTTSLMSRTPGKFKVGVAGGPVIDWRMYEVMYTERYMETPESNPEGYKNANLLNHCKNLEGRLLMIHGSDDDVVVWQHSLAYLKQSVKDRVMVDYFVYPGHKHNVTGKDRIHLLDKISRYFFDYL